MSDVSVLLGQTLTSVEQNGIVEIRFTLVDGRVFKMYHSQDCCEGVTIEDVCGDLNDLVGSPLTLAEESTNRDNCKSVWGDTCTWTFYKFATVKGYVTIRWYGQSNGHYSESVDFEEITDERD